MPGAKGATPVARALSLFSLSMIALVQRAPDDASHDDNRDNVQDSDFAGQPAVFRVRFDRDIRSRQLRAATSALEVSKYLSGFLSVAVQLLSRTPVGVAGFGSDTPSFITRGMVVEGQAANSNQRGRVPGCAPQLGSQPTLKGQSHHKLLI
jgi:hypothetical protein